MVTHNSLNLIDVTTFPGFATWESGCPVCGDASDYCRGHGEIQGDPNESMILKHHEEGNHSECSPFADCQLEIAREFLSVHGDCDNNTCEVGTAFNLGFIRIAASLLLPNGTEDYEGPLPNMSGEIDWPEDGAWFAITATRPVCRECGSVLYVPITKGDHICGGCGEPYVIDEVDILRGRIWSGDWHNGQTSGSYAFSSTGTVTLDGIIYFRDLLADREPDDDQGEFEWRTILFAMGAVLDGCLDWGWRSND